MRVSFDIAPVLLAKHAQHVVAAVAGRETMLGKEAFWEPWLLSAPT